MYAAMYAAIYKKCATKKINIYDDPAFGHVPRSDPPPAPPLQLYQLTMPNGKPYPVDKYHSAPCCTCKKD
jgi:hypothetical protein